MIKGVLIDIAGVVTAGNAVVPGAAKALDRLTSARLPLRFLTNTSRKPRDAVLSQLRDFDLKVRSEDVLTPAAAVAAHLRATGATAHFLIHPALSADFSEASQAADDKPADAVVIGDAADGFTYAALNACFRHLAHGAELLALAKNRSFRDADGELSLDMGGFVAALEFASGTKARIFGKPAPAFFEAALQSMNVAAKDAVMIGDDAEADVAGALCAGLAGGLLVRTGKYREGDETGVNPPPTAVLADLAAAVDWILANRA